MQAFWKDDMLTVDQIDFFDENGYLVVENVLDRDKVIEPIKAEYASLLDGLYAGWYGQGRVKEFLKDYRFMKSC